MKNFRWFQAYLIFAVSVLLFPAAQPVAAESVHIAGFLTWSVPSDYWPVNILLQSLTIPPFEYLDARAVLDVIRNNSAWVYAIVALLIVLISSLSILVRRLIRTTKVRGKLLAEKSAELEFQQRALNEHAIVSVSDHDLKITYVNEKFSEHTGYSREELLGKTHEVLWPNDSHEPAYAEMARTIATGKTWSGEIRGKKKNGELFWSQATIVPFLDRNGKHIRSVSMRTDITESKIAQAQNQLRATLHLLSDEVYVFWPETLKFFYVNQAVIDQTGLSEEEIYGLTPMDIATSTDEAIFRARLQPMIDGETNSITYEAERHLNSGSVVCSSVFIQLVKPQNEEPRFVAMITDISERKAAEKELEQLRASLHLIEDEVYIFWPDTLKFSYVNQAAINQTGREEAEIYKLTPIDITEGLDEANFRNRLQPMVDGTVNHITYETVHPASSGKKVPAETFIQLVKPEGEKPRFLAIVKDISIRKAAEKEASQFKSTLALTNDQVYIFRPDTLEFIYLNQAALNEVNWPEDEISTKTVADTYKTFDISEFHELTGPLIKGTVPGISYELPANSGKTMEANLQYITPEDEEPRFVAIVRDITERKAIERAKAEFISTVSHELRTPLTSIKGSLGLMKAGATGEIPEKSMAMLNIAYNNCERLVLLINDILDLEKIDAGKMDFRMESLDLSSLLDEAMKANNGFAAEYGVEFVGTGIDKPVLVEGDKDRLMQVMANLLSNAAKFSKKDGLVEVSLEKQRGKIRVSVSDKGCGIPYDAQPNIFDRFTQADSSDMRQKGGTGLGLSIVKTIVEAHDGAIAFTSEPDKGTTFYFDLNLPKKAALKEDAPKANSADRKRILVCEDDPDIAFLLKTMLENDGYSVSISHSAKETREALKSEHFDGMTLDIGLPDEDGLALLEAMRAQPETQDIPVIVISADAKETGSGLSVDWLQKPVDESYIISWLERNVRNRPSEKPCILHVEDDESTREIIEALVGDTATVVAAETLREAKLMLLQQRFDLVLLDLSLPDGNGESLLAQLAEPSHNATPVIVFSVDELAKENKARVRAEIVKSRITIDDLSAVIRETIEARA